jgi:hypothetical protein
LDKETVMQNMPHERYRHYTLFRAAVALTAMLIPLSPTETLAQSRMMTAHSSARTTTVQERLGRTATDSRQVTRIGDEVVVDRQTSRSNGAVLSKRKVYDFDDGRVDSVERSVSATDRFGRSASWQGEAERSGRGWEIEGEGHTRSGRTIDVDGFVRRLPRGATSYSYSGRTYYVAAGVYYQPYPVSGAVYYRPVPPPFAVTYAAPPAAAVAVNIGGFSFFVSNGIYYQAVPVAGVTRYVIVPRPAGVAVTVRSR